MLPLLISVKAPAKYQLQLRFEDGTEGTVDVSYLSGKGVFRAWDEDNLFFRPFVNEMGGIAWNEFLDLDVLNAYLTLKNCTFDEWKQRLMTHAAD